jgi:hypothetical protein
VASRLCGARTQCGADDGDPNCAGRNRLVYLFIDLFAWRCRSISGATRRFRIYISPSGLQVQRESVLFAHHIAVPLAHLKIFAMQRRFTQSTAQRSQEIFSAVHVFETRADVHHAVTPALGGIGAIDALVVEMNDALESVRQYGITPKPVPSVRLYSLLRRFTAWLSLAALAALLVFASYALIYERQQFF